MKFSPEENDVIISSYPKCGASFVSQIVHLILRNGQQIYSTDEYFSFIPLLEMVGADSLSCMPSPRCIKTYIPPYKMNYSQSGKYIYVVRRFRDCVVSYYKHTKMLPAYFFTDGTFDDFLDLFVKGEVVGYSDFYRHFEYGYYKRAPNILFITYESLTDNLESAIIGIAGFLGQDYRRNLLNSGQKVLKDILFFSNSFMKYTVDEFWREMFFDKLLSAESRTYLPIAEKYVKIMKEAEENGHYFNEMSNEIEMSKENHEKLEKYLKDNVFEEWYREALYFQGRQIYC